MSSLRVDGVNSGGIGFLDLRQAFGCGDGFSGFGFVGDTAWRERAGIDARPRRETLPKAHHYSGLVEIVFSRNPGSPIK